MKKKNVIYSKSQSFFLFGPRGTGKTSWLKREFPNARMFDLLDTAVFTELTAHPGKLEALIPENFKEFVILDEIQKIPALLDHVHRLIENRGIKFALTGSSARKLKRNESNLLGGRALRLEMHPFTPAELGEDFDFKKALKVGLLPSAYFREDPTAFLKSYVMTYLREEVQQEGLVRNLGNFSRFLEAASFSQASLVNMTKVAEDAHLQRKAVESYFQILEDLLIAVMIEPFTKRAKRKTSSHSKFFYFDAGVFNAIRPRGPLDSDSEIAGYSFETLVFQVIRAINANFQLDYKIHYWRTQRGEYEVDFILYGPKGFFAIEVKSSDRLKSDDFRGLKVFCEDYPEAKPLLIYGGDKSYSEGKVDIYSAREFFEKIEEILKTPT